MRCVKKTKKKLDRWVEPLKTLRFTTLSCELGLNGVFFFTIFFQQRPMQSLNYRERVVPISIVHRTEDNDKDKSDKNKLSRYYLSQN